MNLSESLQSLRMGHRMRLKSITGDEFICERLHELGLRPGLQIEYLGQAPLGGPVLVRFLTTTLALRIEEARCLIVSISL